MSLFLSKDELAQLTGFKRKSDQCAYLDKNHIPYRVNALGEPIVTVAFINGLTQPANESWQPKAKLA